MASQNINQYNYPKLYPMLKLDSSDMSLTSDERDFNEEVIFSPYLIAETYGDKLPINIDLNKTLSNQKLTLTYKNYNYNNVVISQNYYNPKDIDLNCELTGASCDIGLTGIDNGLVNSMTGETIYFTNGLLSESEKFDRLKFDRRFKMFQVTGNTSSPNVRFSGFDKTVLYEMVSKYSPFEGTYHELYGGFYQGFYKLFGYDYEIFPERMNKGWSVEMVLKPRLINEFTPNIDETTLNQIYPNNKNTFFYFGTRAENKFYHHADGYPDCITGYTRVTSGLTMLETCSCCNKTITNSRCIYVYPPRSKDNIHDPHANYGCDKCKGNKMISITCGCGCDKPKCETCGWECQTHTCNTIIYPTPTPTPSPIPQNNCVTTPICTPSCSTCEMCDNCDDCVSSGFTSIENTCEVDPMWDALSNNISFRLCGNPKNPQIGIRALRFTGDCETTGTCTTGLTYTTGYTVVDYCTPPIYPYCEKINPLFLEEEHWFQINVVWERNTFFNDCDLRFKGGLDDITKKSYLESLANNSIALITVPYTKENGKVSEQIELVNLNETWLKEKKYRKGKLKIYINGKLFYTIEDFEEVIPRALNTDKERQVGVPFNISWGGGTQGLRENLTFKTCSVWEYNVGNVATNIIYVDCYGNTQVEPTLINSSGVILVEQGKEPQFSNPDSLNTFTLLNYNEILYDGFYQQDPENLPTNDLSGTSLSSLTTNILIEQNFAGTFEGAISQFRMYTTPLSSPEIKHNFQILQKVFKMFNPDCPDCSTTTCLPNDFTYTITEPTTTTTTISPTTTTTTLIQPFGLGRELFIDERDKNFLIENKLKLPPTKLTQKYWDADGWWGDQGNTPQCVGFAWSHWIDDGPIVHKGPKPNTNPTLIYREAQKIDEWPGENYAGTSVRAGAKFLQRQGKIKQYLWTTNLNTLVSTILTQGPVVVGTNWYYGMFFPDRSGRIKISSYLVGGHAYLINGVDTNKQLFRIKNSWGRRWGQLGHAFISFSDMSRLMRENGEICLAVENNF